MKYIKLFETFVEGESNSVEYDEDELYDTIKDRLAELDDRGYTIRISGCTDELDIDIYYGAEENKKIFKSSDIIDDALTLISVLSESRFLFCRFSLVHCAPGIQYSYPKDRGDRRTSITFKDGNYQGIDTGILVDTLDDCERIRGLRLSFIYYGSIINYHQGID